MKNEGFRQTEVAIATDYCKYPHDFQPIVGESLLQLPHHL
jgi:hypothetical protein